MSVKPYKSIRMKILTRVVKSIEEFWFTIVKLPTAIATGRD